MPQDERKKCQECRGKGYTVRIYNHYSTAHGDFVTTEAQVRCEECHGTGFAPYEGDRSGTEWERVMVEIIKLIVGILITSVGLVLFSSTDKEISELLVIRASIWLIGGIIIIFI